MATHDYSRQINLVNRMLTKFGQDCTITTTNRDGTTSARIAKVAEINVVRHILGDTGIQIGDRVVVINNIGVPLPGDSLVRLTGGVSERFMIVDPIIPIKPAGTVVGYECYLRKA